MESKPHKTLLATGLTLMCVLTSSGYVARHGATVTSVAREEESVRPVLDQKFEIKYGQELVVKGQNLKVKFVSVLEDSRCPTDVKCVWEGDAKVLISVRRANAAESKIELHTHRGFTRIGKYQRFVIKLIGLDPYPKTNAQKKPGDYVATLLIKKE